MKRFIALFVVFALSVTLAGCSLTKDETTISNTTDPVTGTTSTGTSTSGTTTTGITTGSTGTTSTNSDEFNMSGLDSIKSDVDKANQGVTESQSVDSSLSSSLNNAQ